MIDLLKQYVDSGTELSEYQLMKLPKNLLITYFRRITIDRNLMPFVQYELDKIVELVNSGDIKENDLLLKIIDISPKILKNLDIKSEEFLADIIKNNPMNIEYISNPSEELQLMAVNNWASSIQYIKNPTEDVQLAAVKKNLDTLKYIKNPYPSVKRFYIQNY
jgi:hypothetical protein